MILGRFGPPEDRPAPDALIPGITIRFAIVLVGIGLTLVVFGVSGWLAVGIILALLAAYAPEMLLAWLVVVFLAIGQLARQATWSWHFLLLLAGLHLLHVLATMAIELPWQGWLQPAVFRAPLRRFVTIQIPSQLLALVALLLLAPDRHGHRPLTLTGAAVIGAAALTGLAVLVLRGRLNDPPAA
jgi:hypothetical protein